MHLNKPSTNRFTLVNGKQLEHLKTLYLSIYLSTSRYVYIITLFDILLE